MHITIICVPYQIDVTRWGCALGPQAFLDHGLIQQLQAKDHTVTNPIWIELQKSERTRDSVTNLWNIAKRTSTVVNAALYRRPFKTGCLFYFFILSCSSYIMKKIEY